MRVPELGAAIPRRGNALTMALGRACLSSLGWRIEGSLPDVPKCVVILAPHTSNWDFVLALSTILALGIRVEWLGKDSIFRAPFRPLLGWLGGIPVDRHAAAEVVESTVAQVRARERIFLGLSPEGTRRKVERWKSGFYRIAHGAGIPILPVSLDYRIKVVDLASVFVPTGDYEADLTAIQSRFDKAMALYPDSY